MTIEILREKYNKRLQQIIENIITKEYYGTDTTIQRAKLCIIKEIVRDLSLLDMSNESSKDRYPFVEAKEQLAG